MGAKWQHIRSILNPRMLKPKHVMSYTDTINKVVTDFIDRVDWLRETSGQGVMVNDLAGELYNFAFEGERRTNAVNIRCRLHGLTRQVVLLYLSLTLVTPADLISHFYRLGFLQCDHKESQPPVSNMRNDIADFFFFLRQLSVSPPFLCGKC